MFCLYTSRKLSRPQFEVSLQVKVMGSDPGYLLKKILLYTYFFATIAFPAAIFKDGIGIGDDGIRWRG